MAKRGAKPTIIPHDALLAAIRGSRGILSTVCARLADYAPQQQVRGRHPLSRDALDRILRDNPEATALLREERERTKDAAEGVIHHHLAEKNLAAAQWYLQTQAPERGYAPLSRHAVEVQGQVNHTHVVVPQEQVYDALDLLTSLYGEPAPARLASPPLDPAHPHAPPARPALGGPPSHGDLVRRSGGRG